jgi:hypothetical protein
VDRVQVPILSSVYSRSSPDFERSYPINLVPIVEENSISKGYLRGAPGVTTIAAGPGSDGGGIFWSGMHYRLSGGSVITIDTNNVVTVLGAATAGRAAFAYSFDKLAVAVGNGLYLLPAGSPPVQVTDPDLGGVRDVIWTGGYFMTTDGSSLVVTELNDPTSVDPLKYGSSEADPDDIVGLIEMRTEVFALNRYTIEVFQNVGGTGFPFQRTVGAMIPKGAVGTFAKCKFLETFAFCGSGRNEAPGVYLAGAGQAIKISNRALDKALAELIDTDLAAVTLEAIHGGGEQNLFVHLPDESWVYSYNASQALDLPVWYRLRSGSDGGEPYRPRGFVRAYGNWYCGDNVSAAIGVLDDQVTSHFGDPSSWQFDATMIYTTGSGAICHELALEGMFGRSPPGVVPEAAMSWSEDGLLFSQARVRSMSLGTSGERMRRPVWRQNGRIRNWRIFRFAGANNAVPVSFSRLNAALEPLNL